MSHNKYKEIKKTAYKQPAFFIYNHSSD